VTVQNEVIRIRMEAYDHSILDQSAQEIVNCDSAEHAISADELAIDLAVKWIRCIRTQTLEFFDVKTTTSSDLHGVPSGAFSQGIATAFTDMDAFDADDDQSSGHQHEKVFCNSRVFPAIDELCTVRGEAFVLQDRMSTAQRIAAEMFIHQPDWVTYFREVLGVDGIVRKLFSNPEEMAEFEKSLEYADIQQMLAKLRERGSGQWDDKEPTCVITVRLPKSLHVSLKSEAHSRRTSMNQLCISKLLQVVDEEFDPIE